MTPILGSDWLVCVQVSVLAATLSLLVTGLYGLTLLKMEFRPEWMLDPETECQ